MEIATSLPAPRRRGIEIGGREQLARRTPFSGLPRSGSQGSSNHTPSSTPAPNRPSSQVSSGAPPITSGW